MIAFTLEQAAARVCQPLHVIHEWVRTGALLAVRNPVDGLLYVEVEHLLDVDQAAYLAGTSPPPIRPDPLPIPLLALWLWEHGTPVTERALRDWVETRALTPVTRGRGTLPSLYDPLTARAVAEAKARRLPRATDNITRHPASTGNTAGQAC